MCEHNNSVIKYCKKEERLEPVLFCNYCMTFVNDYLPKYDHTFFTHGTRDLESFLAYGTEEERREKVLSLNYGLKSILEHYTDCDCGYDDNYTFIFGTYVNDFKLLEHYFLKKPFPQRIIEKLKPNKNKWTSIFRLKYNI
jgi:hypothetical protein